MKILPGQSEREFILHFEDLPEFELCFRRADKQGYFDLPGSALPSDCTLIARTVGSPRTRRIKPVQIVTQNDVQRIHISKLPQTTSAKPEKQERPPAIEENKLAPAPAQIQEKYESVSDRIHAMSVTERTHLALKADFQERRVLMQDNNLKIQEFLLRNPRITEPEIAWLAKNPLSPIHTVLTIMQNKAWMSTDSIRVGILTNPKTPPANLMDMIPRLSAPDLKRMHQTHVLREDLRAAVEREAKKRGIRLKPVE